MENRPEEGECPQCVSSWLTGTQHCSIIKGITLEQACRSSIKGTDIMDDFRYVGDADLFPPPKKNCVFCTRSVSKSTHGLRHDYSPFSY
jgi:hypothetical protein